MRASGYLYAIASLALMGAAGIWATGTEALWALTNLTERDGQRYATAFPSDHDALARCVTCHRVEPAGPERSAPPLVGILDRPVAAAPWFGYSPALARKGGSWSRTALDAYLANPVGEVPGTFKTLSPITDAQDRTRILDALARL